MTGDFMAGVMFWARGWAHIFSRRSLIGLAVMPFVIAVLATGSLVWVLWTHLGYWTQMFLLWITASHSWIAAILHYPLLAAGGVMIFLSSIYVVYVFQALAAVPFNSMLAARTLKQLGKSVDEERLRREWLIHTMRMIAISLVKAILLLCAGILFFMLSFLPVLNILALAGTLMILAGDCMDYSFEALGFGLRRRAAYLMRNRMQWIGMATGLALTLLVPGLTFLVIPGAVVGAAILVKAER
jgi:uncharacterized protein involved in cysteine biosynthesis